MNARKEWKLTQYALGEMEAREKTKFEKSLEADAGAREEMEAIRAFTEELSSELRSEEAPELTEVQRQRIARQWAEPRARKPFSWKFAWSLGPVAAVLIGVLSLKVIENEFGPVDKILDGQTEIVASVPQRIEPPQTPVAMDKSEAELNSQRIELAKKQADDNLKLARKSSQAQMTQQGLKSGYAEPPKQIQMTNITTETSKFISEQNRASGGPSAALEEEAGDSLGRGAPAGRSQIAAKAMAISGASKSGSTGRLKTLEPRKTRAQPAEPGSVADDTPHNTEAYDRIEDNAFKKTTEEPLSTFSSDVDTASYANLRRFLTNGQMPPKDAVRIEEMVNYFPYSYAAPKDNKPFAVNIEVNAAPWNPEHRLVRIGIKGKEIAWDKRAPSNLTFLLDTSGSMDDPNKLPLVKGAMKLVVDKMNADDHIAIAVYAGSSGMVLPPTSGKEKEKILAALENLQAGGSTNGGEGIELAYKTAQQMFRKGGINRVILATDGDFNVGTTSQGELTRLIETKAKGGVFLTVLGFGMGNLKDSTMEKLADKGNGNYAYIDSLNEAKKVFVHEIGGTLMTIAKDVKLQVEFNPAKVDSFRLIGYENRIMAHQDFNDDTKDAGDIGAGHTVTALYEIVPFGKGTQGPGVDALKYQKPAPVPAADSSSELLTLKLRYKEPEGSKSELISVPVTDDGKKLTDASTDYKFASAVAAFGMILRESPHKGTSNVEMVLDLATGNRGADPGGYRTEFLGLVEKVKAMKK